MLDRIDIHVEVPRVDYEKLSGDRVGETSGSIRKRVQAARIFNNNALPVRSPTSSYTLQAMLGHTTLDMVKRYLAIAQTDLDRDHEKASPVKGWGL